MHQANIMALWQKTESVVGKLVWFVGVPRSCHRFGSWVFCAPVLRSYFIEGNKSRTDHVYIVNQHWKLSDV